jgi:hypothetical protein
VAWSLFRALPRRDQAKLIIYTIGKGFDMSKVLEFLKGKKAYLTAIIAILTAVVARVDGLIDNTALVSAVLAALSVIFIRSGVTTEVNKLK